MYWRESLIFALAQTTTVAITETAPDPAIVKPTAFARSFTGTISER